MKHALILIGLTIHIVFCSAEVAPGQVNPVSTTLNDFLLPGSQPGDSGNLETPSKCDNCHGGYDAEVEPAFNWRGSMMAQAARDPLYLACMAIANQDAPDSGDLCIRCHSPSGWLEGRSVPTDGSALNNNDREGVQCDFCHKLVDPQSIEDPTPYDDDLAYVEMTRTADKDYLATLAGLVPPAHANGMYAADSNNAKRGPFVDAAARHKMFYSPFHSESQICGTCHDVSNPVYEWDGSAYRPNAMDTPSPSFDPQTMFPVERTFSEWAISDFNTVAGVEDPAFVEFYGKATVHTCQDCHMHDVTGYGCSMNGVPLRTDLPLHDLTGGNSFVPALIQQLYPDEVDPLALAIGEERARATLQKAATVEVSEGLGVLKVKVTNLTGHKLPSGYPEGRRIWINLKFYDAAGTLLSESGEYDMDTADLISDPQIKVYEIKPGIGENIASVVNLPADVSFHFVLNNKIYKDNRIPPIGATKSELVDVQSPGILETFEDGANWDETSYDRPVEAVHAVATLYYQTLSKEYVTFLRDENRTNDWGNVLYDLWAANGKSAPEVMAVGEWRMPVDEPLVIDRHIFYNNSRWDGHDGFVWGDPAANLYDDNAIAVDKHALVAGQIATFDNYTSYARGINGIMIDVANLADPEALTVGDLEFHLGNSDSPSNWPVLALDPSEITVSVREGAGTDGSDRVAVHFPDGAVQKAWLQVTLRATAATGLKAPDVHYWGNAVGDSGNSGTDTSVNVADQLGARANPHTLLTPALIDDVYDYNRDKQVNVQDELIARSNPSTLLTDLNLIDLSGE